MFDKDIGKFKDEKVKEVKDSFTLVAIIALVCFGCFLLGISLCPKTIETEYYVLNYENYLNENYELRIETEYDIFGEMNYDSDTNNYYIEIDCEDIISFVKYEDGTIDIIMVDNDRFIFKEYIAFGFDN